MSVEPFVDASAKVAAPEAMLRLATFRFESRLGEVPKVPRKRTLAPLAGTPFGFQFWRVDHWLFGPPQSQVCAPSPTIRRARTMAGLEWRARR
jgi:hypothetical protein